VATKGSSKSAQQLQQPQVVFVREPEPRRTQPRTKKEPTQLFKPWYDRKKRTTYFLLVISFGLSVAAVIYDVLVPDVVTNGIVMRTVTDATYTFLNFLLATAAALYAGRRATDAMAMAKIDQASYESNTKQRLAELQAELGPDFQGGPEGPI
jgi:Flp pilus assembly protein TadB